VTELGDLTVPYPVPTRQKSSTDSQVTLAKHKNRVDKNMKKKYKKKR
jgi:hypothetical protein